MVHIYVPHILLHHSMYMFVFIYMQVYYLPPPPPLPYPVKSMTEYELNIKKNNEMLRELGMPTLVADVIDAFKIDKGKQNMQDEDENILENEEESEDDSSKILPKVRHKNSVTIIYRLLFIYITVLF